MNRLSRYIFVQTFGGVVAAASVITAVILLIDFVETSRDIATRADISALQALYLSLLKSPLIIQDALPFMVLFGVLFTFFRLSRRSELIVMRASGYSAWRILAPAGILTVVLGIASATLLNPLGAAANARFETLRDELLQGRTGEARGAAGDVWLREQRPDGYSITTADRLDADAATLFNPVFRTYLIDGDGAPLHSLKKSSRVRPDTGQSVCVPSDAYLNLPHDPSALAPRQCHRDNTGRTNGTFHRRRRVHWDRSSISLRD